MFSFLPVVIIYDGISFELSIRSLEAKKWIYSNIESKLWEEATYDAVNGAFESLSNYVSDYMEKQVQACRSSWQSGDRERDSFFGTGWRSLNYILGGDSWEKTVSDRNKIISNYQNHCAEVMELLGGYYSDRLSAYRDSLCEVQDYYGNEEICNIVLGTPKSFNEPDTEFLYKIADLNVQAALKNVAKPTISSCTYDKEKQLWTVRLDHGESQYVKFYKRDDGDYDIERGNALNIHDEPIVLD